MSTEYEEIPIDEICERYGELQIDCTCAEYQDEDEAG